VKIKIEKSCKSGGVGLKVGQVHDLSDRIAQKLIERGYAKAYTAKDALAAEKESKDADQPE
jgi:hypothetical protein